MMVFRKLLSAPDSLSTTPAGARARFRSSRQSSSAAPTFQHMSAAPRAAWLSVKLQSLIPAGALKPFHAAAPPRESGAIEAVFEVNPQRLMVSGKVE